MRPVMLPALRVRFPLFLAALALAGLALPGATAPRPTASPAPLALAAAPASELIPAPPETKTVTVFLVRHAEKSKDDPRDPSLSAAGQQRARRLAELLAQEKITHLFSTPLKRTQETLAPLARAKVPIFHIHGDSDSENAALPATRVAESTPSHRRRLFSAEGHHAGQGPSHGV